MKLLVLHTYSKYEVASLQKRISLKKNQLKNQPTKKKSLVSKLEAAYTSSLRAHTPVYLERFSQRFSSSSSSRALVRADLAKVVFADLEV